MAVTAFAKEMEVAVFTKKTGAVNGMRRKNTAVCGTSDPL